MCGNCNSNISSGNCSCGKDKCRIAVTVEDNFAPCAFPKDYFDITVRDIKGKVVDSGRVAGGSSLIFSLPCGEYYAVTAAGGVHSAPRAQTRRVYCCCGETSGVTFIFMNYECDTSPVFCPPCPCPPPMPPCPCPPPPRALHGAIKSTT